jgi:3-hydroxyacyl-CoA dehydrogenase
MIGSAAVLGAGTMGAQIAAHLANAGLPVLLLDVTAEAARAGLERARKLKPDPFFLPETAALITTGSFDDRLAEAGRTGWVIEAIIETLDAKQSLLRRLEPHLGRRTIVSTNTSGIPINSIAEALAPGSGSARARFLGTHFFNPPRYLRLVEVIPAADTDPAIVASLRDVLERRLGKGVVIAHDRPGFIANRIGLFGLARTLEPVAAGRFSIDEVDALTGVAIGRQKSATFRTADIAGLDIIARVARDLETHLAEEAFRMPPFVEAMVAEGALGEKSGRGFFQKVKGPGGSEIHVRDLAAGGYVPRVKPRFASVDAARSIEDVRARVRTLFLSKDRAGDFLRETLGPTLLYAARIAGEVADSIDDVDRAMRWGFGWELGPFETWDAIGIREVLAAANVAEADAPPLVAAALAAGRNTFRDGPLPPAAPDDGVLGTARTRSKAAAGTSALRANAAASLVDLGDGVLALDLHSKLNTIGGDTLEMLEAGVETAASGYAGLVIGTEGPHFSAGANLMLLLLAAQEGEWDDVDLMVRRFQRATTMLRTSPVPVVAAVGGLALGGGCEILLHTDRVQAAAESYIGLVEAGVGLVPAGGGTKEMLARAMEAMPEPKGDLLPHVQRVFELLGFGKVSTSAPHAQRLGYLRAVDATTMNRDRLVADAKRTVLARAAAGYQPPPLRPAIPVGGPDVYAALALGVHLAHRAGRISDHDATVGRHLARILTGGDVPHRTTLTEQQLLDLEREAFLKLTGERKTLERIAHTLKTGKMLRN